MLQINKNIKLIRELSGKKQGEFARLIKTNLSNLKTYENSSVRPKANVVAAICDFAGITAEDLENRLLTHKDIHFPVDKVESNGQQTAAFGSADLLTGAHVTLQDYIDLLKEKDKASQADKDKLLSALEKLTEIYSTLNQVKINSDAAKERLDSIVDEVRSEHAVIMDSLDRVEKNPVGTNAKLAGNLEVDRRKKRQEKGRHANAGK